MAGRIKGAVFREYIGWLGAALGPRALDEIVARMPVEHRRVFDASHPRLGILAATWYPAGVLHAFLDAIAVGRSDAEVARIATEGSRGALEATLTGVHRALLRVVASPGLHARFAQRLWDTYYEEGIVTSECVSPSEQVIRYRDWKSHHPMLCRITTASDLTVFSLMGLSNVSVEQLCCIREGAPDCAHVVRWTR
jgi:hypothetical protein